MASIGRGAAGGDGLGTPLNHQADVQRRIKYAKRIVQHQLRRHSRVGSESTTDVCVTPGVAHKIGGGVGHTSMAGSGSIVV